MPLLPVLVVRAMRWGVESVLYLGVDKPDGVSESCSRLSTIFGMPGVRHCLALSSSAGPGLKAILYLKQPEAYVSLIFAKVANQGRMLCPRCEKILWISHVSAPVPQLSSVCVKSPLVGW